MVVPRIAVVGGGVSACSIAYGLRDHISANKLSLHLFEMGRAPGGRATTRGTRERPELRVDHGAPAFAAHTPRFESLCESMVAANALEKVGPPLAFGTLKADNSFELEDAAAAPTRYVATNGQGLGALCEALLRGGSAAASPVQINFSTMVGKVEASTTDAGATQWTLSSNKGVPLGSYDFLVITSTGLAHPRWRTTFGGEPPLVEAAAALGDATLGAALSSLAPLTSKPVTACLLAYEASAAVAWAALPFYKARIEDDDILSRVVVQRISPTLTAVVLHSTHAFSRGSAHVYGATSTAARLAGAASDKEQEQQVLETMLSAAAKRLGPMLGESAAASVSSPAWGPHLHRWGAAFPDAPLLPEAQALVPSASVAFSGDYVDGGDGRAGSVEGAALSGLKTAEALVTVLGLGAAPS